MIKIWKMKSWRISASTRVAVAFQLTYFETRYDAESEEGLELEPEETQAPSGLANADASNLQRSTLETAAEAALGE